MGKNIFLLLILLMFSCKQEPSQKPPEPLTECDLISQDPSSTFYEDNSTYILPKTTATSFPWSRASFNAVNMDGAVFNSGINMLVNHQTLLSFILMRNNKVVVEKYFHQSDKNQSNNIHSASKCIISALVGIAIEQGFIKGIDQPILDFFPDYIPDDPLKKKIVIKDLLNMTSGLQWIEDQTEYKIDDSDNWVNAILDLPMNGIPGVDFNYSSGNTHLLSAILKKSTNQNTCEFMNEQLMNDLGIGVEHWGMDPSGNFSGGYNFYISPREMAQFGRLFLHNGEYLGKQLIPSHWINTSLSQEIKVDDDYKYSYCWWSKNILEEDVFIAWGYGGQFICLIPKLDIIVVATSDTQNLIDEFDIENFIEKHVIPAVIK